MKYRKRKNEHGDVKVVPQQQEEANVESGKDGCGKCNKVVKIHSKECVGSYVIHGSTANVSTSQ